MEGLAVGEAGRVNVSIVHDDRALWGAKGFLVAVFAAMRRHRGALPK